MDSESNQVTAIPLVDYLDLSGPEPRLYSHLCLNCGARFFDRRNACASCGQTEFERTAVARTGAVHSFTIVYRATPDVEVPYFPSVVELDDGKMVKANLVGINPDPDSISPRMPVRLTTWVVGHDPEGIEAVTFGFQPLEKGESR